MSHAKPISWAPSQYWDGIDGNWSSFPLRVGTPEQLVRVLPSTAASETWIVVTGGCAAPAPPDCTNTRGGLFDYNQSTTWDSLGLAQLNLELNLGHNESGLYGHDHLSLGINNATGGPTLDGQLVTGIQTAHYWNGIFGLTRNPEHLGSLANISDTYLTSLKNNGLISSLSWAYTAGASYRSKGVFGSLTFGGSDLSRYTPSNISFTMASDVERDLVVGVQSITSKFVNGSTSTLLPSPILSFIDSTLPYIWLPTEACQMFESTLGLTYNDTINTYLIDEATHQELLLANPEFTFTIGNDQLSTSTVEITLPYSAFDLVVQPPLLPQDTLYFPIRRANTSQFTLGRVFFQEAYIIADYDNNNFTVAQALFNETPEPNIVPIPWNATVSTSSGSHLSKGSIAGISIGAILAALIIMLGMAVAIRKCLSRPRGPKHEDAAHGTWGKPELYEEASDIRDIRDIEAPSVVSMHEMGHSSIRGDYGDFADFGYPHEIQDTHKVELLDHSNPSGSGRKVPELLDEHGLYGSTELQDGDSPSGLGQDVRELADYNHLSGSRYGVSELQDERSASGSGKVVRELPGHTRLSGGLDGYQPSGLGRHSNQLSPEIEQSPSTNTSQSKSPSTVDTNASTHTSFGALFDPRRRVTKTSTADRSSETSSTMDSQSSKNSKTTLTKGTPPRHPSFRRSNLDKDLPQIPPDAVSIAKPVTMQSYRSRNKGSLDTAPAYLTFPNKAFTHGRPRRKMDRGDVSPLP